MVPLPAGKKTIGSKWIYKLKLKANGDIERYKVSLNEDLIQEFKVVLHVAFTIKDLGVAHYFLGMEIARRESGTTVNQRKYILDLISTMGLTTCTVISTQFPPGIHLQKIVDSLLTRHL